MLYQYQYSFFGVSARVWVVWTVKSKYPIFLYSKVGLQTLQQKCITTISYTLFNDLHLPVESNNFISITAHTPSACHEYLTNYSPVLAHTFMSLVLLSATVLLQRIIRRCFPTQPCASVNFLTPVLYILVIINNQLKRFRNQCTYLRKAGVKSAFRSMDSNRRPYARETNTHPLHHTNIHSPASHLSIVLYK